MRFLQTADWHLGKTLRGRSRVREQEAVLAEILDIARKERIDCLLVCGDVFDSHAPSPEAERLALHFMAELVGRRLPAVIVGGNHDHPRRLAALRQLTEPLRIFVRSEPLAAEKGGVIELPIKDALARIAVLPFVSESKVVGALDLVGPESEMYAGYDETVAGICRTLCRAFRNNSVNLLVGHLFVRGAVTSGSERAIHVSRPYEVSARHLPSDAHAVVLGHLHRPQELAGPSPIYYAGSPLQLDFGEQGQQKRVVLIEAEPGRPASFKSLNLSAGRRLQTIRGTIAQLAAQANELGKDYLRVTVQVEAPVPGIPEQVREMLPNALDIRVDYPRTVQEEHRARLRELTPDALFTEFYRSQRGADPSQALLKLFRQLYQEATDEAD
jgi:exonuclease SbcD